ncbi:hypothetical protein AGDE_13450 [Angomonas deanei]|uniref:Tetratricopeptide repeat n=1 Tax=Angomonas deanei TaxID=59799 RepID=A0A7G2C9P8_9TRYP|nr:hypothetical protein AGDE_13450 [Angomonas deanei]CAD2216289.1 hypothetical protein, conserved [Angomonas deanei]|eukprot:EPY22370.1 hypothetical protein AGDE_13450 [Angomonas deanei]
MDSVSWVHRALSSLQIGSNIRALRTVECQRYLPSPTEVIRKVPLQRIFAALGDRDSSKTVHHMTHDLPPEEAVFSFENNGEWHLALQNCELVLQHMPNSVPHQLTSLRCMRQLGQLHLMSRYSQALLNRPESRKESLGRLTESDKKTVLWYANEAAWRL